jgi:hypothetical protein
VTLAVWTDRNGLSFEDVAVDAGGDVGLVEPDGLDGDGREVRDLAPQMARAAKR